MHQDENEIIQGIFQGLEIALIASVIGWITYVVYQIIFHPRDAFKMIPRKLRSWSLLRRLGVTDRSTTFRQIPDHFTSVEEIAKAMRSNGLERANLIVGIDFTASNEWQGRKSFGGRSLHHISIDPKSGKVSKWNPYQKVIRTIGETMRDFDDEQRIPVYGFGDVKSKDTAVFPLLDDASPCKDIEEVLVRYTRAASSVSLSGPSSFAPIIRKAVEVVRETEKYHVLLIIADGRLEGDQDKATREAIVDASDYPLSIVVVGVGDGPWEVMHTYDDQLPQRRFDNFQFVEFMECKKRRSHGGVETEFALQAMMELPDQYRTIKALGLLKHEVADLNQNARDLGKNGEGEILRENTHETRNNAKETDV